MKIFSIIVTYNPDVTNLDQLYQKLVNSQSAVIIIENSENSYIKEFASYKNCYFFELGKNTGIAFAQNTGIRYALENEADIIVFFDQDSKIEDDFLSVLLSYLVSSEIKVVAPVFFDNENGSECPSFKLNKWGLPVKVYSGNQSKPYNVDIGISSGSATTKLTFDKVGLMDEDFFIDYVDIEWFIRCRFNGVPIQVIPAAKMNHSIGMSVKKFGTAKSNIHNPERSYYQIRNSYLLLRKKNVPFLFAAKEIASVFYHKLVLIFFVKNKVDYIKNYWKGLLHGLKGVTGKKPE